MKPLKRPSHIMRPDGKIVVDVRELLQSERVRKDLGSLRLKLQQAEEKRFAGKNIPHPDISPS